MLTMTAGSEAIRLPSYVREERQLKSPQACCYVKRCTVYPFMLGVMRPKDLHTSSLTLFINTGVNGR